VDMRDLLLAMDRSSTDPSTPYLDLETGAVRWREGEEGEREGAEEADEALEQPGRYVPVPRMEGHEAYAGMQDFAAGVEDDNVRERLLIALDGEGAFGRFRRVVAADRELEARWHAARQSALLERALRWLATLGIDPVYELLQPPAAAARPEEPTTQAGRIGLLEVLLLGAPDGKTELLEDRVYRLAPARTPAHARRILRNVAMDLCSFFGVGWRKRFVEGGRFELEGYHVEAHDDRVELSVQVERAVWDAFS